MSCSSLTFARRSWRAALWERRCFAVAEAGASSTSSQMGTAGYPGRAAYCATKHAVEGLTKALGVEWAPHGIHVNAVAPTFVETPLTRGMLADPAFREEVQRRLPAGRLATMNRSRMLCAIWLATHRKRQRHRPAGRRRMDRLVKRLALRAVVCPL